MDAASAAYEQQMAQQQLAALSAMQQNGLHSNLAALNALHNPPQHWQQHTHTVSNILLKCHANSSLQTPDNVNPSNSSHHQTPDPDAQASTARQEPPPLSMILTIRLLMQGKEVSILHTLFPSHLSGALVSIEYSSKMSSHKTRKRESLHPPNVCPTVDGSSSVPLWRICSFGASLPSDTSPLCRLAA